MAGGNLGRRLAKKTQTATLYPAAGASGRRVKGYPPTALMPEPPLPASNQQTSSSSMPGNPNHPNDPNDPNDPNGPNSSPLFGEIMRLDARRRGLGCTQSQLASIIQVSQATLSRLFRLPHQVPIQPQATQGKYMQRQRAGYPQPQSLLASAEGLHRIELALNLFSDTPPGERPPKATSQRVATSATFGQTSRWNANNTSSDERTRGATPKVSIGYQPLPKRQLRATYRLLIAEDDQGTADLYTMLFNDEERLTYEITLAATPRDCLDRLQEAYTSKSSLPYDLLLMDLGLGERRDQIERSLLNQLCQHPAWVPPQILVVSGAAPTSLQVRIPDLEALGAAYLAKPFDIDELLEVVYTLVTGVQPPLTALTHLHYY